MAALASLPGVLLGWVALSAGGAELAARRPFLGRPDVAVGGTAALVALLAAPWLRASAPAACAK